MSSVRLVACVFFFFKKVIELILLMHSILNDGVAMEMSAGLVKEDPRVTKARGFKLFYFNRLNFYPVSSLFTQSGTGTCFRVLQVIRP